MSYIGIDTNILYYMIDNTEKEKHDKAIEILKDIILNPDQYMFSIQVLAELVSAVKKKGNEDALQDTYKLIDYLLNSPSVKVSYTLNEFKLSYRHDKLWDALIAYTYFLNGCRILYTENIDDMPNIEGLKYINPFKE